MTCEPEAIKQPESPKVAISCSFAHSTQAFDWQQLYAVDANITMCGNATTEVPHIPVSLQQYIVQGFVGGCMSSSGYEARPRGPTLTPQNPL